MLYGFINADDIIAFCLYLMNKMRCILIKRRSCATFRWTNHLDKFSSYFRIDGCLFDLFMKLRQKAMASSALMYYSAS